MLPESIAWEPKEQFSDRLVTVGLTLSKEIAEKVTDEMMANTKFRFLKPPQNKRRIQIRTIFENISQM